MPSLKKITTISDLTDLFKNYHQLAVVKIAAKTTHQQLESLRKELNKAKAKLKVVKNTLFEKTINKLPKEYKLPQEVKKNFLPLRETNALLVLDKSWSEGLKKTYEFAGKDKNLSFHFAILDGQVYPGTEVEKIAQLPGRDQLMAQVIGSFKSPVSRLNRSIKYGLTNLVYILRSKSTKAN